MKTSLVFLLAIFINTSILLSQPLLFLAEQINPWMLVVLEIILVFLWYLAKTIKELHKELEFDFNGIDIFVFGMNKKVSVDDN